MNYYFNPAERNFKITVFADSSMENLNQDLSELFKNTNYKINIRIVDTLYTIKKTKSKITIIEQPYERKIAEYTNYKGYNDIVDFLINQFNWLCNRNTNDFNKDMINNLINDKNNEYLYLYDGVDCGYSIGVVGSMIVLITPDKKKLATDFYLNGENMDFLQIKLDYMIKENMLENKLPF